MRRRLVAVTVVALVGVAGCSGDGDRGAPATVPPSAPTSTRHRHRHRRRRRTADHAQPGGGGGGPAGDRREGDPGPHHARGRPRRRRAGPAGGVQEPGQAPRVGRRRPGPGPQRAADSTVEANLTAAREIQILNGEVDPSRPLPHWRIVEPEPVGRPAGRTTRPRARPAGPVAVPGRHPPGRDPHGPNPRRQRGRGEGADAVHPVDLGDLRQRRRHRVHRRRHPRCRPPPRRPRRARRHGPRPPRLQQLRPVRASHHPYARQIQADERADLGDHAGRRTTATGSSRRGPCSPNHFLYESAAQGLFTREQATTPKRAHRPCRH